MFGTVDILLAAFNGEKYIREQIGSILNQTYKNFRLIISDGKSDDNTIACVKEFSDPRIVLLTSEKKLNPKENFSKLINYSSAAYVFFCDQDDYWHPEKMSVFMSEFQKYDASRPLLVHCDLSVVNGQGAMLGSSFWTYSYINPVKGRFFNRLLMQNSVTGCASACNRKLLDIATAIPEEAVMHDWWLALIASAFGSIAIIHKPLQNYRQHENNAVGALKFGKRKPQKADILRQGSKFFEEFGHLLDKKCKKTIVSFLSMHRSHFFLKRGILIKNRFYKSGFLRNLRLLLFFR